MDETLVKIGQKIREERIKQSISQEELAFRAEMDRSYLSEVETGQKNLSVLVLLRIAKALGVSSSVLID